MGAVDRREDRSRRCADLDDRRLVLGSLTSRRRGRGPVVAVADIGAGRGRRDDEGGCRDYGDLDDATHPGVSYFLVVVTFDARLSDVRPDRHCGLIGRAGWYGAGASFLRWGCVRSANSTYPRLARATVVAAFAHFSGCSGTRTPAVHDGQARFGRGNARCSYLRHRGVDRGQSTPNASPRDVIFMALRQRAFRSSGECRTHEAKLQSCHARRSRVLEPAGASRRWRRGPRRPARHRR